MNAMPQAARAPDRDRTQDGVALLTALMILTLSMLLGASAAQMTLMNEKVSRNGRDRTIAFLAAEAALQDALLDLASAAPARADLDSFPTEPGVCHHSGTQAGLCLSDSKAPLPTPDKLAQAIAYGSFTGRAFSHGNGALASAAPRYLIELVRLPQAATSEQAILRYRITAIGYGPHPHSRALLQAVHAIDTAPATLSQADRHRIGARLSWREITDL
jgi:type IV pilus assembly protein PilX